MPERRGRASLDREHHGATLPTNPSSPRPFLPSDFHDTCEDCGAPPGAYCRPHCESGFTAADARRQLGHTADGGGSAPTAPA